MNRCVVERWLVALLLGGLRAATGVVVIGASAGQALWGCSADGYPIAPTRCDDWCFATQRASCSEDNPEHCVSECEQNAVGRVNPGCEAQWVELTECYAAEPDTSFSCTPGEGTSAPRSVCLTERASLAGCAVPGAAACFDNCVTEMNECGRRLVECEYACAHPAAGCEAEQRALDECKVGKPLYCGAPEDDPRLPEEIPCLPEIGAVLTCAGWPGTSAEGVSR